MLPGSRPGTLQRCKGCCDWLDKLCRKSLSTSSNIVHQNDFCDVSQHEVTLLKDSTISTGYDNQWRHGGGRFFAYTGSLLVAADCSSKVTALDIAGRRHEEHVCYEYSEKQSGLCTGLRRIGQTTDATTSAVRSCLIGEHGNSACGNDANGSLLQCWSSSLGLSVIEKTCRSSTVRISSSPRTVHAGSLQHYETLLSFPTEYFLSPAKELLNFDRQSLCVTILKQAERNPVVGLVCSKFARHGYISRGRGAVALLFKTSEKANQFIRPDFRGASLYYAYLNDSPLNSEWPGGKHKSKFAHLCQFYNPECQYIFSVTVDAYEEVCSYALYFQGEDLNSRMDDDLVARFCAKLPLYILSSLNLSLDINDAGATLILTSVPGAGPSEDGDERRTREVCFINIQQKLRQRGVSLRHQFPEIYRRLCAHAENGVEFAPLSLFMFDSKTGKKFLCLIMPNSEPFCSWTSEFGELGLETIV